MRCIEPYALLLPGFFSTPYQHQLDTNEMLRLQDDTVIHSALPTVRHYHLNRDVHVQHELGYQTVPYMQ